MSLNLKELAEELDDLREAKERIESGESTADDEPDWDEDRLAMLEKLEKDLNSDLHIASRNLCLIADGKEFVGYCQDLVEEQYGRDHDLFPYIDWDRYAADVQTDFTSVEFDDETYYYRG